MFLFGLEEHFGGPNWKAGRWKRPALAGRGGFYPRVVEFANRFRGRNGSVVCRALLGCDISTPDGMTQALERNLFKTTCVKMVEDAAMILEEMEAESQPAAARDD